jgi:hypothetical protein
MDQWFHLVRCFDKPIYFATISLRIFASYAIIFIGADEHGCGVFMEGLGKATKEDFCYEHWLRGFHPWIPEMLL